VVDRAYIETNLLAVRDRLVQAGVRLGGLLNQALETSNARPWKRMGMRATRVCPSNRMPSEIGVHRHIEHDRARPVGAAV
jgi:hypothetical protein